MVALTHLERGINEFAALAGIADAAIALAATHGKVDTRVGIKIGADVALLDLGLGGLWASSRANVSDGPAGGANVIRPVWRLILVADIITCLEQLNGFGNPDTGGKFTEGASKFYNNGKNDVYGILKSASVDRSRWNGDAADRYDAANTALKAAINPLYAVQMVALDTRMAEILARQADQVQAVGEGLAGARLTVLGAIEVVSALEAISCGAPGWFIRDTLRLAIDNYANEIAKAVGGAALGLLTALLIQADQNASDIEVAKGKYDEVAKAADGILKGPTRVPAALRVPVASGSGVLSGTDGRVAVGAVSGAGSGDDSPTPETPSPCELTQLSGPAAKLSRQVSQSVNVVNPVMGPVQPLASMARQATPAKQAPAKEAPAAGAGPEGATLAQDLAGAGVAPGAASAQSMPIEVVARTQPGPDAGAVAPSNALPPSKP